MAPPIYDICGLYPTKYDATNIVYVILRGYFIKKFVLVIDKWFNFELYW